MAVHSGQKPATAAMQAVGKQYKMKISTLLILFVLIQIGCISGRYSIQYSDFIVRGKKFNHLIERRIPDYGDGLRDGCVVLNEISMELEMLTEDIISGKVLDSTTKEPMLFTKVRLFPSDKSRSIAVVTDSIGHFEAELSSKLIKIQAEYVGYRLFEADLTKIKQGKLLTTNKRQSGLPPS